MCNKGAGMSWKPTLCSHGNQYIVRVTPVQRIHLLKLYTQHLDQDDLQYGRLYRCLDPAIHRQASLHNMEGGGWLHITPRAQGLFIQI